MDIEFGCVQEYNTKRGFGFVSRTFKSINRPKSGVWFHITVVKCNYPNLARELDTGSSNNVSFWYEIDSSEREKVSRIWLDVKDIPDKQRNDLVAHIEHRWRNIDNSTPDWLNLVTVALVGQLRRDELDQERRKIVRERKEAKEQEQRNILESYLEEFLRDEKPNQVDDEKIKRVYIGLPEHLAHLVLWVNRVSRTHPWSHIPGGSDVVVEYRDGHARGYDWIKKPSVYIRSFFAGEILRVYVRRYNNEHEYFNAPFEEVWNSETSNEMPWESLEKFERRKQNQYVLYEDNEIDISFDVQEGTEHLQWLLSEFGEDVFPDHD